MTTPIHDFAGRALAARTALLALCDALNDVGAVPSLPSPEATRPTWVRVTCRAHSDRHVTIGKVYEVVLWNDDGSPDVIDDDGDDLSLSLPDGSDVECWPSWEPATPPAPVEPAKWRDEAFRALLAYAECATSWFDDNEPGAWARAAELLKRNGWDGVASRRDYVAALGTKALTLARTVRA